MIEGIKMDEILIKANNISKAFGEVKVLNDISFSLKPGEILGFAGLMGSGRTEILETLFGRRKMEMPSTG